MLGEDLEIWDAVAVDLRGLLRGLSDHKDGPIAAPVHYRLAVMRLQRGLIEDATSVREALGAEHAGLALAALDEHLRRQLDDEDDALGVLQALRPAVRAEAMLQLHEALQCDAEHAPALRAATALASVSGRWTEAAAWLDRLASIEPPDRSIRPLLALADVHWRKLGGTDTARRYILEARERAPEDPAVLDKLLKLDLDLSHWPEAVEACLALIAQIGDTPEGRALKVTYLLTLGEIHVYGLQKPAEALLHYLDALRVMPDYALTYTLVRELFEGVPWATVAAALPQVPAAQRAPLARYLDLLTEGAKSAADASALVSGLRTALLAT
ncbi:MAG: hypothetical protein KC549_09545 [Myxococcales bacterium]|nr:hypothetical protein [Myxococcales bacterium]MCB9548685.1 hypothetical protein [Myxococcales bacterium]